MEPYFVKFTSHSWIAEDGTELPHDAPRVIGHYFIKNPKWCAPLEAGPDVSDMVRQMVDSPPAPPPGGSGGSPVPLVPPPKGSTPIGGVAMPLPKILRA